MLLGVTPAQASEVARITSQRGITQAQWEATEQYKSFACPTGTGRGIGVDMNFTTDQSDDTWFATCNTIEIIALRPIIDTSTATVSIIVPKVDTPTVVTQKITTPTVVTVVTPTTNTATSVAASVDTSTIMVVQPTDTSTAQTAVTALSDVVMATKSGVKVTKKENAKVLVRKKGKK